MSKVEQKWRKAKELLNKKGCLVPTFRIVFIIQRSRSLKDFVAKFILFDIIVRTIAHYQ